mmetsp:Transcript_83024/g.222664  ORF Transcript_83024/g.222664 Transcript_83024/m.222664 type:complete len:81 (-) Transcript_83024:5-247(-)
MLVQQEFKTLLLILCCLRLHSNVNKLLEHATFQGSVIVRGKHPKTTEAFRRFSIGGNVSSQFAANRITLYGGRRPEIEYL